MFLEVIIICFLKNPRSFNLPRSTPPLPPCFLQPKFSSNGFSSIRVRSFGLANSLAIITYLEVLTTWHHTIFSFIDFSCSSISSFLIYYADSHGFDRHFQIYDKKEAIMPTVLLWFSTINKSPLLNIFLLMFQLLFFHDHLLGNLGSTDTHDLWIHFVYFDKS